MIGLLREFRIIPVVLVAASCLLGLKILGLALDGGYTLVQAPPLDMRAPVLAAAERKPPPRQSWAQEVLGYPDAAGSAPASSIRPKLAPRDNAAMAEDITGSVAAAPKDKPAATDPKKPPEAKPPATAQVTIPLDAKPVSASERAILERLQERREEIEGRARELDIRETLIKAAEQKLEARAVELKDTESRIVTAMQKKEEAESGRLKSLVTMYENMKAKEAARVFDRLDMRILIDIANQINPRRMSDILALMSPEAAERLTVELATRGQARKGEAPAAELPKIEGRPRN